jgi:putative glycosyltransferase (TIGR04372 family)
LKKAIILHPIFEVFWLCTYLVPGGTRHRFNSRDLESIGGNEDHLGLFFRTTPHLGISATEDREGRQYLSKAGLKEEDQFVCFCLRDQSYLDQIGGKIDAQRFRYHQYRDVDVTNYQEAAIALADRGYWIFRMGKVVDKPFEVDHPKIVDYASSPDRCDFLDIWLLANCYFCVSTGLGIDSIAELFRRPLCVVDYLPVTNIKFGQHGITTPKSLVWSETGIELTVEEHLLHNYKDSALYDDAGIDVVNLSSNKLTTSVLNMDDLLIGKDKESQYEQEQQKYFWQMLKSHYTQLGHTIRVHPEARISSSFLYSSQFKVKGRRK